MLKKLLIMLSLISILIGPMVYLSIVNSVGTSKSPVSLDMPEFGFSDLLESAGDKLPEMEMPAIGGTNAGKGTTVYKWQDASGVWQYSNERPSGVAQVETVVVTPNTSIQAYRTAPEETEQTVSQPQPAADKDETVELELLPTPSRVKKLIEDAKNVQNLVDERARRIEAATE